MFNPKKVVYADLTFIDVAGLTGEATERGKDIIQSIKTIDAIAHVVRLFDNGKRQHSNLSKSFLFFLSFLIL